MEELSGSGRIHKVMMTNRRSCAINGVNDVLSFDVHEILLETEQGMLMIKGEELHVSRLTLEKGEVLGEKILENRVMQYYVQLNKKGRKKILEMMDDYIQLEKYRE